MVAKKKKKEKSSFFSILFIVFLLLVVSFLAVTNWRISRKRAELVSRIDQIKENINDLEEKKKDLQENLSKAGSQEFIEEKAREDLGFKKPNEDMIVITKEFEEEKEEEKKNKEWWEKLKFWE